jgi:hypothetical protein
VENTGSINGRLEALRKREAALKAAIAEELVRQQKRKAADDARAASVVGEALLRHAEHSPQFTTMLKQVLQAATLADSDRAFLTKKGWL